MYFFHIQPNYWPEKFCIFFQATLLYEIVELIINDVGDCWINIVSVRHIDVAECWKLEEKFADVQNRNNVHTNIREDRLRNSNLSLVTPILPPRQRGDLKSLLTSVRMRKVNKTRHFVNGPYKNMWTVSTSNHEVKQKFFPSLQFGIFSERHCSCMWVLIWRYVPYMFQEPLPWVLRWLHLVFCCCCLQPSSL